MILSGRRARSVCPDGLGKLEPCTYIPICVRIEVLTVIVFYVWKCSCILNNFHSEKDHLWGRSKAGGNGYYSDITFKPFQFAGIRYLLFIRLLLSLIALSFAYLWRQVSLCSLTLNAPGKLMPHLRLHWYPITALSYTFPGAAASKQIVVVPIERIIR